MRSTVVTSLKKQALEITEVKLSECKETLQWSNKWCLDSAKDESMLYYESLVKVVVN